jgi:plasmid stabilization system protein ParE
MNFTVVWKPEAERRLANIWTDSTDRNAVTRSAGVIDRALKDHPENLGESRGKGRRVFLEAPLGVVFQVSSADRMVTVLTVWDYERRSQG